LISYAGGTNLYGFVGNAPLAQVDPLGLCNQGLNHEFGSSMDLYRYAGQEFGRSPEFQPGSQQRVEYSQFLDTLGPIGAIKGAYQAATGRDPVAGTNLAGGGRVLAGVGTIANSVQLGRLGEAAVDGLQNTKLIPSLSGTATFRRPDRLTDGRITEIKMSTD
jgi:hypothetical protein